MRRRAYIGAVVATAVAGCVSVSDGNSDEAIAEMVEFEDVEHHPGRTTRAITGRVTNTGDSVIVTLWIQVKYFDSEDVRLDESATNVGDLEPGVTTEFSIGFFGDDSNRIADYEIGIDEELSRIGD